MFTLFETIVVFAFGFFIGVGICAKIALIAIKKLES